VAPPAGATNADVTVPISCPRPKAGLVSLGAAQRNGHEPRPLFRLHAHQHAALAVFAGLAKRLADFSRRGDGLPADLEDHVAGLEAEIGGGTGRINLGHDDTGLTAARR